MADALLDEALRAMEAFAEASASAGEYDGLVAHRLLEERDALLARAELAESNVEDLRGALKVERLHVRASRRGADVGALQVDRLWQMVDALTQLADEVTGRADSAEKERDALAAENERVKKDLAR